LARARVPGDQLRRPGDDRPACRLAIENCEPGEGGDAAEHASLEITLMAVSSLVALAASGSRRFSG
jgi:hypothetical protein